MMGKRKRQHQAVTVAVGVPCKTARMGQATARTPPASAQAEAIPTAGEAAAQPKPVGIGLAKPDAEMDGGWGMQCRTVGSAPVVGTQAGESADLPWPAPNSPRSGADDEQQGNLEVYRMAASIGTGCQKADAVASPGEAVTHADEPCPGEPEDPGGVMRQQGDNRVLKEKAQEGSHTTTEEGEAMGVVTHQEDEPGQAPAQEPGSFVFTQGQERHQASGGTEGEPFGQGVWTRYDPGGEQDSQRGGTMLPIKPTVAHIVQVAGGRRHECSWMLRAAAGGGHEAEGAGRGLKQYCTRDGGLAVKAAGGGVEGVEFPVFPPAAAKFADCNGVSGSQGKEPVLVGSFGDPCNNVVKVWAGIEHIVAPDACWDNGKIWAGAAGDSDVGAQVVVDGGGGEGASVGVVMQSPGGSGLGATRGG